MLNRKCFQGFPTPSKADERNATILAVTKEFGVRFII